MKKSLLVGLGSFVLIVMMICGFVGYHFVHTKPSDNPEEVVFEIPQGKSFQKVANELEDARLIQNANLFSWYARFKGQAGKMKVGEYSLRKNMAPAEVLSVIISGKSIGHSFTVSEGLNMFEIADLYETEGYGKREDFLNLCMDKELIKNLLGEPHDSLEGYLYPETYQLTKFTTTRELVQAMVHKFQEIYAEISAKNKLQGFTKHQIVTLASIIEKETGAPEERPLISSIFHNRLLKGMMLQTDPTIIYGLAEASGKTVYKISKQDILRPSKYNTYVIKGLPPGPIGNPGREALLAAIEPAQSKYLFFVSQNNGTHVFSEDYAAHSKAVQKFQLNARAREGKSWRDLQKRKTEADAEKVRVAPESSRH
jgi:UPF0755 protein